jgi:hypothetical protein
MKRNRTRPADTPLGKEEMICSRKQSGLRQPHIFKRQYPRQASNRRNKNEDAQRVLDHAITFERMAAEEDNPTLKAQFQK